MLFENLVFFVFLLGLTSGVAVQPNILN